MRVRSTVRQRIKERVMVHQEQQKVVFNILFTVFITVYIILFIFIQASLKFIKVIVIRLIKGILGTLSLLYKDSKEGSRQPINL